MRIAYIGNFNRPWCTEVHVAAALAELGHQVVRLQENRTRLDGQTRTMLATRPPDLFMWTRTWGVDARQSASMMAQLRAAGVPIVSFHLDRYLGIEREGMVASEAFFHTDMLFTPDGGDWAAHGVRAHWMPPGVDGAEANQVYKPNPRRWPWKVAMVGSYPYPHPDWQPYRRKVVDHLRARYGDAFAVLPADAGSKPIRNADLGELYATVPVLVGDSCWPGLDPKTLTYWSDRVPETLGRGGYLIHPWAAELQRLYPDLTTYPLGDLDALTEQIDFALENPEARQAAARSSRELVLSRDTYRHRMAELVATVTDPEALVSPPLVPLLHVDPMRRGTIVAADPYREAPSEPLLAAESPATPPGATVGLYRPKRLRHAFQTAEGVTDAKAVKEVWDNDDYVMAELGLPGATVIDIGANIGAFTVLAALLGAAKVIAYEPHPETFKALQANVAGSPVAGRCELVNAAVGGWARSDELVGVGGAAHFAREVGSGVEVPVLDIDAVLDNLPADVVIKLDCEGAEYEILEMARDLGKVKTLVMEWHGPEMPHLTHLDAEDAWPRMVRRLADLGRLTIHGHPTRGGLLWMRRYGSWS